MTYYYADRPTKKKDLSTDVANVCVHYLATRAFLQCTSSHDNNMSFGAFCALYPTPFAQYQRPVTLVPQMAQARFLRPEVATGRGDIGTPRVSNGFFVTGRLELVAVCAREGDGVRGGGEKGVGEEPSATWVLAAVR